MKISLTWLLCISFTLSAAFSSRKEGSSADNCPYLAQHKESSSGHAAHCPLHEAGCPFYDSLLAPDSDGQLDMGKVNWARAAELCPIAHDCPFLKEAAIKGDFVGTNKIPRDHLIKLMQKCPKLAEASHAASHIADVILDGEVDGSGKKCPFLAEEHGGQQYSNWKWVHELLGRGDVASTEDIVHSSVYEKAIEKCPVVQEMNAAKLHSAEQHSKFMRRAFTFLFPSTPAVNSLLATAYISGPPNLILALVPPNIDLQSLNTLVAFAVGGLLGDVFLHLLPQVFLGEGTESKVKFVLLDEKRNTVLGLFIFIGFASFFIIDKSMRIMAGGNGDHHSHAITPTSNGSTIVKTPSPETKSTAHKRSTRKTAKAEEKAVLAAPQREIKVSAYLNLIADATHNVTDGLAISASFYISPLIGAITALAVFCHEIPHEVSDYAILVQSGFTKWQAMAAQFLTAGGAFLGTFIGIGIQQYSLFNETGDLSRASTILGANVTPGELVLPVTAGGFLYIATAGVIPELLEHDPRNQYAWRQMAQQIVAMSVGISFMYFVA